ncbi:MAG TPA: hypothetical protein DEP45_15430, partial [Armatimonadetes bacterium]|nr:hypothetical protein [Armatimonadota bacterium]
MRTPAVIAATLVSCSLLAFADVTLVEDGQARAAIVIPAEPLPVEQYAADELAYHVERATGVLLPIATEADLPEAEAYVFIGATKAAAEAGIDTAALAWEETVLRTEGNRVIIAGQDEDGDPLSTETSAGTLWGVYELLERDLGVVWMWPGELGTHVPQTDSVVFRPELAAGMTVSFTADGVRVTDERFEPWLLQRGIRAGNMMRGEPPTQRFTPEARAAYLHDQSVFVRRHRMGRNHPLSYGHAFNSWWDSYGAEHPEWFQLVNDRRGP